MVTEAAEDRVLEQYEQYPYPKRDPEEEGFRLVVREAEYLARINHYLFGGAEAFQGPFRILIAGGGTGDDAVFLAEQLRGRPAEIVYVDPSLASLEIARGRAAKRGLDNIVFHQGRIQELEPGRWGLFDYICCIGVLHHLPDPAAGLARLASVLSARGGIGFLLYGTHGRRGLYQVQRLMRLINGTGMTLGREVENAMGAIAGLLPTHPFFRLGKPEELLEFYRRDPIELVDAVLHAQDVSYTVPELYDLVEGAGLKLVDFTHWSPFTAVYRMHYQPASYTADPKLRAQIAALPRRVQQEIGELMHGAIDLHAFYVSRREDAAARIRDPDMVPFFMLGAPQIALTDTALSLTDNLGRTITVNLPPGGRAVIAALDGSRTLAEIVAEAGRVLDAASPGPAVLRAMVEELYEMLFGYGLLLLRHRTVPAFQSFDDQYYLAAGWRPPAS
jgi:SAM-dependent methyltransferase